LEKDGKACAVVSLLSCLGLAHEFLEIARAGGVRGGMREGSGWRRAFRISGIKEQE
jgi:hypothetical protein